MTHLNRKLVNASSSTSSRWMALVVVTKRREAFIVGRFLDAFDEELQLSRNCRWSAHRNPPLHDGLRATFLVMIRCLPLHMEGCADVASMGPVDCGTLA